VYAFTCFDFRTIQTIENVNSVNVYRHLTCMSREHRITGVMQLIGRSENRFKTTVTLAVECTSYVLYNVFIKNIIRLKSQG